MMALNDAQIRLIILYMLKAHGIAMSETQLTDALVHERILDYFTMMQHLREMEGSSLIAMYEVRDAMHYTITNDGVEMLKLFSGQIPSVLRDGLNQSAERMLSNSHPERLIHGEVITLDVGRYAAAVRINEGGIPLYEMRIYAGSITQAQSYASKLRSHALELYKMTLDYITDQDQE